MSVLLSIQNERRSQKDNFSNFLFHNFFCNNWNILIYFAKIIVVIHNCCGNLEKFLHCKSYLGIPSSYSAKVFPVSFTLFLSLKFHVYFIEISAKNDSSKIKSLIFNINMHLYSLVPKTQLPHFWLQKCVKYLHLDLTI